MIFVPDHRNMGGRQMIVSQVHNHRSSLQQMKKIEGTYRSPYRKKQDDQFSSVRKAVTPLKEFEKNLVKHQERIKEIQAQECVTERQIQPSYFFRRICSPSKSYIPLLHKKPLSYSRKHKTKSTIDLIKTTDDKRKVVGNIVPQTARSQIDWEDLIKNLHRTDEPLKLWIQGIAFKYQIYTENDFATLIRILMQAYPKLRQNALVNITAQIIEELEN